MARLGRFVNDWKRIHDLFELPGHLLNFVYSEFNVGDLFTKALERTLHERHTSSLGLKLQK